MQRKIHIVCMGVHRLYVSDKIHKYHVSSTWSEKKEKHTNAKCVKLNMLNNDIEKTEFS